LIHLSGNLPHTRTQYIEQQYTGVFARDLTLSVENVHSLERYRDRSRSGCLQFLPNIVCSVGTGNVEVYTRSTDIYWTPSASAGRTTHLYSWEPTVWNHVQNRELRCYRRRAKSWPSYTATVMALHRDITREYTQPRYSLFNFFPPLSSQKLNMTFRARTREPVSVGFYFGSWTRVVFMSHDGEYVTYVPARIVCYVNIFLRWITQTKILFRLKYRPCEICYKSILL